MTDKTPNAAQAEEAVRRVGNKFHETRSSREVFVDPDDLYTMLVALGYYGAATPQPAAPSQGPVETPDLARYFFEIGYGACWSDAFMANDQSPVFPLSDASVDRAWEIAAEATDDPEEFDRNLALASARSLAAAPPSPLESGDARVAVAEPPAAEGQ